jgi:hypothetical protein
VDPINIAVEFEGADEAASSTDRLVAVLEQLAQKLSATSEKGDRAAKAVDDLKKREQEAEKAAKDLAQAQQQAVQKSIEFTSRIAAATGAIQSLAAAMGTQSDAAGLVSRVAATTAAFTQLGSSLGPVGAAVGAALGIVTSAVEAVAGAQEEAARQAAEHAEQLRATAVAAEEAAEAMRRYQSAGSRVSRAGQGESDDAAQAQVSRSLRGQFTDASDARTAIRLIDEHIEQLRESTTANRAFADAQIENLQAARANAEEAIGVFERIDGYASDAADSHRGAAEAAHEHAEALRWIAQWEDQLYEGERAAQELQLERDMIDALGGVADAQAVVNGLVEEFNEEKQKALDLVEQEGEAQERLKEKTVEAAEEMADAREKALNAAQEQVEEYGEVTKLLVGGITDAVAAIVEGTKSSEEAFAELLAGFLAWISEKAAINALAEAAEAIGSYPDPVGMATHAAAAAAWGAVAIAAGAGSAAAGAGARAAGRAREAEAEPERGRSGDGGGGGGSVVINWNAPVYTSGQRAEMGRELQQMIQAGQQRYG